MTSASPRLSGKVDGFRFDGRATATLREHRRRASAQYVDGRIRVSMGSEAWLFTRMANCYGTAFNYRLSKDGALVRDAAIAMEARQGGDGDNSAPSEGRQRGPARHRPNTIGSSSNV